jgi:hypothetical protein
VIAKLEGKRLPVYPEPSKMSWRTSETNDKIWHETRCSSTMLQNFKSKYDRQNEK